MSFTIPNPSARFDLTMEDGSVIRVRRFGKSDAPVRMFVSHGNGFAVDGYYPFWGPLAERCDLVVFDFRNHGHNAPSDPANHNYAQMARDLERVYHETTARLGKKTTVGVFHSMSAHTAMKHAIEIGWRWDALMLFDPPNVPPTDHPEYARMQGFEKLLADWAAQRRARFGDPSELAAEYMKTRAHRNWVEGTHELMARAVLRRDEAKGDWVLTCAPALESAIYMAALSLNLWPKASATDRPKSGGLILKKGRQSGRRQTAATYKAVRGRQGRFAMEKCRGRSASSVWDLSLLAVAKSRRIAPVCTVGETAEVARLI